MGVVTLESGTLVGVQEFIDFNNKVQGIIVDLLPLLIQLTRHFLRP